MQFTLNYWVGTNPNREVARIYVNFADGTSPGYFEEACDRRAINPNTAGAYERHRWAKGQNSTYSSYTYTWSGDDELADKILDAVFALKPLSRDRTWRGLRDRGDLTGLWLALRERARGFRYAVTGLHSRDANTRERARDTQRGNAERQELTFDLV